MAGDQVDTDVPGSNPPGSLSATTGVLLYSAATPLTITVAGNLIVKNIDGIWSTNLVTVRGVGDERVHRRCASVRERGSRRTSAASDVVIRPLQT